MSFEIHQEPQVMADAMQAKLMEIATALDELTKAVRGNKDLPPIRSALSVTIALNEARVSLVALDVAIHARHNERHPIFKQPPDLSPTQPLDAETRAEIDQIP